MNEIATAIGFLKGALDILPKIVEVGNTIDAMQKEHEWNMKMKYSESEYLTTLLALYQSRKITASEAKKALSLIFRDDPVTVNSIKVSNDIESELYKLIGR